MGIKEQVLEILKRYKDGLTIPLLDIKYEIKHGRKLKESLNVYLHRLAKKDLVEPFIPIRKIRRGNIMGYKATEKAWEEDRKALALEKLEIIEAMTNRGAIKYYRDKIAQDEINKLEEVI